MRRLRRSIFFSALVFALVACGGDGGDDDGGTGSDGATPGGCEGAADGTECGSGLICVAEECVEQGCGDGFVSSGEQCDDGNMVAFDGCEPSTCTFTCTEASECDDGRTCNGVERCSDAHVCELGTPPGDGSGCDLPAGGAGVCRGDNCVAAGCGNGVPDGGEECDDGNDVDRDGCDVDCTFSCTMEGPEECTDGDVCNGEETCDVATHACVAGTSLECTDGDDCTADECDPLEGCQFPLIDADGDGHAPDSLDCGTDCDDGNPARFEGAEELCDTIDNDCNDIVDDGAPTWYVDCDGDGFAADTTGASPVPSCDPPSSPPAGCGGGGWTSVRPTSTENRDCNDGNADVFPGQTMFFDSPISGAPAATNYDYNCDGIESKERFCAFGSSCSSTSSGGCSGAGYTEGCTADCSSGPFCIIGIPPDCGTGGNDYRNCLRFGSSCFATTTQPVQRCR